jgi:hypothetical protein
MYKITIEEDGKVPKEINAIQYCIFAEVKHGHKMDAACDSAFLAFVAKEADLSFTVVRSRAIEERFQYNAGGRECQ